MENVLLRILSNWNVELMVIEFDFVQNGNAVTTIIEIIGLIVFEF